MNERKYEYNKKDILSVWDIWQEIYGEKKYDEALSMLPSKPIILDVGANIGLFVSRCADICEMPTVYCFEPIPEIYSYLQTNVSKMQGTFFTSSVGIGSKHENIDIHYFPRASGMSTGCDDIDDKFRIGVQHIFPDIQYKPFKNSLYHMYIKFFIRSKRINVTIVPLKDILRNVHGTIHLVKIDCECYELNVLQGLSSEDFARIENIYVEIENYRDNNLTRILEILTLNNFELKHKIDYNRPWVSILACNRSKRVPR